MEPSLHVTHQSTVTPDQIDELGHMNVRYYGRNAVAATHQMRDELGLGDARLRSTYTRHHHEQMEGTELEVRSAILTSGQRLRFFHELRNRADDDLAATFVHELDHPRLEAPGIELPNYGTPRSLSLDSDALAAAPDVDELIERGLAIRLERKVDTEDSMGADVVPTWLTNNLVWGGERPQPEEPWISTLPNGQRMAFANMESRLWNAGPVPVGTRIQSFGVMVDVQEKVTRSLNWTYDLDTREPLAVYEVINLAFNLDTRRSMVIPDDHADRKSERHWPEYAIS